MHSACGLGPVLPKRGLPRSAAVSIIWCAGGEVSVGGKAMPHHSVIHVEPGEDAPVMTAGPDGAAVLFLQFSAPSERPGSDPKVLAQRDPDAYMHRKD